MKVNGYAYLTKCLPNTFYLRFMCSHSSKLRTSKNEISGTSSYVNTSSYLSVAGEDPKCLFSHCEKRHSEPSETISAMWDGTTTHNNIMFFSLSINLSSEYSMMYLCIVPTKYVPCPPRCQRQPDNGAPPPSSEIMPKHDEDSGGIGKKHIGR